MIKVGDNMINEKEINAIRFYMGDQEIVDKQIYRGGNKAYNTINALLHDSFNNEIDLFKENRNIEIYDSKHLDSYIHLMLDIYSAMNKYQKEHKKETISYKIDRYPTIEKMIDKKRIEGFFSTCKYGYLEEYAHVKSNVILLEVIKDENCPYLDFEELFKDKYAKKEEAEILIPFDTLIDSIEELELTNEEKNKYYDMNGNCPVGKFRIKLSKNNYDVMTYQRVNYNLLIHEDTINYLQLCLNQLKNNQSLSNEDMEFYNEFKEKLKHYIRCRIIMEY